MNDDTFIENHRNGQLRDYLDIEETIEDILEYDIVEKTSLLADKLKMLPQSGIGVCNLLLSILPENKHQELAEYILEAFEEEINDALREVWND